MHQVKFYPNERSYYLEGLTKEEKVDKQNFPYRYCIDAALLMHNVDGALYWLMHWTTYRNLPP